MGTRGLDRAKVEQFRLALEDLAEERPAIAIVGRDAEYWPEAVVAAEEGGFQVVFLEEGMRLQDYKRALNEFGCRCLMYSEAYEELAYRVENDGVTLVASYIAL